MTLWRLLVTIPGGGVAMRPGMEKPRRRITPGSGFLAVRFPGSQYASNHPELCGSELQTRKKVDRAPDRRYQRRPVRPSSVVMNGKTPEGHPGSRVPGRSGPRPPSSRRVGQGRDLSRSIVIQAGGSGPRPWLLQPQPCGSGPYGPGSASGKLLLPLNHSGPPLSTLDIPRPCRPTFVRASQPSSSFTTSHPLWPTPIHAAPLIHHRRS